MMIDRKPIQSPLPGNTRSLHGYAGRPVHSRPRTLRRAIAVLFALFAYAAATTARTPFTPLTEEQILQVKSALDAMKKDPRGPYSRIRWYCNDGSVHPPAGTPCAERGGGSQHAEFNAEAKRLAGLRFHVGTILQALSYEEFLDAESDNFRLKELVIENFLIETDDGWVLRKAQFYRGARQIEDEERQGRKFLERLLSDPEWMRRNFLLASRLVSVVPHATPVLESTRKIRNLATEAAVLDSRFQSLRVKIHSFPSRDDIGAVEGYLARRNPPEEARAKMVTLRDELRRHYDPRRILTVLESFQRRLRNFSGEIANLRETFQKPDPWEGLVQIADLGESLRDQAVRGGDGGTNLLLMDLIRLLQDKAMILAQDLEQEGRALTRESRLAALKVHFALNYSAGLLTRRELESLRREADRLTQSDSITGLQYKAGVSYLSRSLDWARISTLELFSPVYERYILVEPAVAGFLDAQLRGSILLPLSRELSRLSSDADALLGQSHSILGEQVSQGIRGLNPGVVQATLEILEAYTPDWRPDPKKIYVIPDTIADLKPVAGILTLDAGNLLSHAQLLARNLGIPNASISPPLLPLLKSRAGRTVFFAVSPMGLVILKDPDALTGLDRRLLEQEQVTRTQKVDLDTSRLRLQSAEPVSLYELRSSDSGAIVGPKAANLGQLYHYFPDRVAPGVALPFGMYYRHINRAHGGGEETLVQEIRKAYRTAEEMRADGKDEQEVDRYMLDRMAQFRRAIEQMEWVPEMQEDVIRAFGEIFKEGLAKGVFVRSDTNAEDLPQFSGAGLNLTVPHQTTAQSILASVKRVWASPFSDRAYLWRKQVLNEQANVYTSVLLLQSVHSEKSGVLITADLESGGPNSLTVVAAEGVGGAVEGESAETIVVDRNGNVRLLGQSKASYRRLLDPGGGIRWVPTRRGDVLLSDEEIHELREVVAEWNRKMPESERSKIWDIEFGFADGKLWLFQIRPFIPHRNARMLERLKELDTDLEQKGRSVISLQVRI